MPMIPWGYGREWYSHTRVEGEHHPWGYDLFDRVGQAKPSNCEDGSGTVYTPSSVPSPSFRLKGGADKTLYSNKVFGAVVRRKADLQGACEVDSSQSWEDHREHKVAHVEPRGPSEVKCKLLANAMLVLL